MAKVNLEINGRKYALGCDEGEEDRLTRLGNALDARVKALADQFGQIGDVRLLVMAGITMSDEIAEMRADMEGQAAAMTEQMRKDAAMATKTAERQESDAINALASAAEQIEKLAAGLRGEN